MALQIAMALSMLISAALLVQSPRGFSSVDPGFRADNLLLASLDPKAAGYESNRIDGFCRAALERIKHIPEVRSVSLARTVPLAPGRQRQPWVNPTSGVSMTLLALISLLAFVIPVRAATRLDAVAAIRHE